jgi:hypothetical protein
VGVCKGWIAEMIEYSVVKVPLVLPLQSFARWVGRQPLNLIAGVFPGQLLIEAIPELLSEPPKICQVNTYLAIQSLPPSGKFPVVDTAMYRHVRGAYDLGGLRRRDVSHSRSPYLVQRVKHVTRIARALDRCQSLSFPIFDPKGAASMPWRFRKRKKLFPGVTLNLSDKGAGVTVGNRGGRVSVNSSGRTTVGASVPGTGIYFQETVSSGKRGAPATAPASAGGGCLRKVLVWGGGALAVLFGASMLASLAPRSAPTVERAGDVVITAAPVVVETTATVAPTMAQAVVEVTVAPSATPLPTATPAPVDTPTAIPTVIPTVAAGAVVIEAANVREGPGVEYAVVIGAQPGQAVVDCGGVGSECAG